MNEVLSQLPSLGIAGLLLVMWWHERLERARLSLSAHDAMKYAVQLGDINDQLLDVIRANTEALSGLREELRSQRLEWLGHFGRPPESRAG